MASNAKDIQLRELKDTVSQLKTMISEQTELIKSLRLIIDEKSSHEKALQEQVDYLTKKLFGSSSEKRSDDIPGQQNLFDEAEVEQDPSLLEAETVIKEHTRKKKATHEDLFKGLKVEKVVIPLPEEEQICPVCGTQMVLIGEEYVRRELEFIPATCKAIEYYSQSYGCPSCKEGLGDTEKPVIIKSQIPAALVGKGPASASTVAWTMYQSENWLLCHVHAYEYFGGVPRLTIPDNLRTGVLKNTRLDTVLNRSYSELADHYGTAIVPARIRRPQDKSHAEGSVSYASTWILAALRNDTFFSLADAKEAVAEKLEELNGYTFKKREGNRRDAYIHEEKEFMQPLPVNPYEPSLWSDQTVLLDYTVTDGLNKYSVPYDLIGESVSVRVTHDTVEVFFHGNRVAVHPREVNRKRDPVMITSHMPENHRQYLTYTKDDFQSWASTIGPNTEKVVRFFLESGKAPEQGFKSCVSLKKYADRYKAEQIEEACRQILLFSGDPSIRGIQALLKSSVKKDGKTDPSSIQRTNHRRSRGFTRGAEQFREGGDEK